MNRRNNFFSYLITMCATIIALFCVLIVASNFYDENMMSFIIKIIVGAIVAGFVNALVHELGHLIAGKKNGFVFSSMAIWFFKWSRIKNKIKLSFTLLGEEAGYTEMIPSQPDKVCDSYKKMTRGGIIATFMLLFVGIPPLFMPFLNAWIYSIWSMFLVVGIYYFFGAFMPVSNNGVLNDGAVLFNIKKQTDTAKVMINLLKIQAHLYNGKTPSEIDKGLYFDLPQLVEDDINFALLLNARYSYYLDKGDYLNAKKTTQRMLSLEDYLPRAYLTIFKIDALYNACTFDFDEMVADDLMYEVESYINKVNNATNIRVKLAYLLKVRREKENLDMFIKKGYKEANECQIKGLGRYEIKLLEQLLQ